MNYQNFNYHEYDDSQMDDFEQYMADFDPIQQDRRARRKRRKKVHHEPKVTRSEILDEIADTAGLEGGFETTYQPSLYEEEWLLSSLRPFYEMALITDVLSLVKGGKEASVYRCAAHESTGETFLAAKVYRPRKFRNLRNDKLYRQGREVLTLDGKPVDPRDIRTVRAIGKKSAYGQQVSHTSWLMYEFKTLQQLHAAGADIPEPFGSGENAVLMSYIGDENLPAPTLNSVDLTPDIAQEMFEQVMWNIDLMLQHGLIHGDLSAYNILTWQDSITLIDFPQVTDLHNNDNARFILSRDITRVCDYFSGQGVDCDASAWLDHLWSQYVTPMDARDLEADLSRLEIEDDDDDEDYQDDDIA